MKGYLNGVRVVGTINLRTFIGKILSIILAYSSCLALGPEGPMVHIGAMVGGGISGAKSSTLGFRIPIFQRLRNDRDQRDFIASGSAAGITAGKIKKDKLMSLSSCKLIRYKKKSNFKLLVLQLEECCLQWKKRRLFGVEN